MNHESKQAMGVGRRAVLQHGARVAVVAGVGVLGVTGSAQAAAAGQQPVTHYAGLQEISETLAAQTTLTKIRVPDSALAREAMALAQKASPATLFNHVMRTYLFGALLFDRPEVRYDRELTFVACMLHDLGLVEAYMSPAERFELDGADVARRFLLERGVSARRAEVAWDAIALHTNAAIAARKQPEIAAVAAGAALDVSGQGIDRIDPDARDAVLAAFPRLGFKRHAIDGMISLCRTKPMAQVLHPFAEVGRRHIPGFAVPTAEDLMLAAPFAE